MIDRHNYEEFFLLYVDNELTVEQKKQVELFVEANQDLEEELVMLQQSRLIADESIVFPGKEKLMKEENDSFINMNNYEEYLVLYIDNELNEKEKITVEQFATEHSHVKEELALFQQTKLQPEEIVFAGKQSLYRREERVRVLNMSWVRIAVAAVLILAALMTGYSILNKNNKGVKEDIALKDQQNKTNDEKTAVKETPQQDQNSSVDNNSRQSQVAVIEQVKPRQSQKLKKEDQKSNNLPTPLMNRQEIAQNDIQNKPTKSNEIIPVNRNEPEIKTALATGEKQSKLFISKDDVTSAIPVSYNPTDNGTGDALASNDNSNKKLRGFFRKATRFIERTTNVHPANDDDRVLIGGMAINLK